MLAFGRGQLQVFKQHASQLLRRTDVERLARQRVNLRREPRNLRLYHSGKAFQFAAVDTDSGALHARQHARQRKLDFVVQLAQAAAVHRRRYLLVKLQRDIRMLLRRRTQLQIHTAPRLRFQRASRDVRLQQERVQHHIVLEAARFNSQPRQFEQRALHVAGDLDRARIFQPRRQRREMFGMHGPRLARAPRQPNRVQRELAFRRFRNRHRYRRALRLRQPARQFVRARNHAILPLSRVLAGSQLLQQAVEFHLLIDGLQQFRVGCLRLHRVRGELHRHIASRWSPGAGSSVCARRCSAGFRDRSSSPPRRRVPARR